MEQGTVLRIERLSPNDGQGLRTVVFFKGCPLRCEWCSTPESQLARPEWFYMQAKCRRCSCCVAACPQSALSFSADGGAIVRDRESCTGCFKCARACLPGAIGVHGKRMTVEQVMKEIRKDSLFYFYSGGGVTLSGGDVLLQADFAHALLKACDEDCLNTTAELDMYGPYENVAKVLEYIRSYHVDIKLMDSARHRRWTGVENTSILENTLRASTDFPRKALYVRVPLIPGVSDSRENIDATVDFCKRLKSCKALEFLPFHRLGAAAYQYIGRPYAFADNPPMTCGEARARVGYLTQRPLPFEVWISGKRI